MKICNKCKREKEEKHFGKVGIFKNGDIKYSSSCKECKKEIYEKDKAACTQILEEAEIIFTLDFNALHRTGEMETVLSTLKAPFIMIDHHPSNMPIDFLLILIQ